MVFKEPTWEVLGSLKRLSHGLGFLSVRQLLWDWIYLTKGQEEPLWSKLSQVFHCSDKMVLTTVVYGVFTRLYNPHRFIHTPPKTKSHVCWWSPLWPSLHSTWLLITDFLSFFFLPKTCFLSLWFFLCWPFHVQNNHTICDRFVWFLSLSMLITKFSRKNILFVLAQYYSIVWIYYCVLFICLMVDTLDSMDNAAMNIWVQVLMWT